MDHYSEASALAPRVVGRIEAAIDKAALAATDIENFSWEEARSAAVMIHRRVVAVIRADDEDVAERRMGRNVAVDVFSVTARMSAAGEA